MSFAVLADFKARVKSLTDEEIEASSEDETLANECLTDSQNIINRTLLGRDIEITSENISTDWPECSTFHLDIATYLYGQRKGWEKLDEDSQPWIQRYDKRKQLRTIPILLADGTVLKEKIKFL